VKVLILVLSHHDNGGLYDSLYESQKKTWDSEIVENVETFYYFGDCKESKILGKEIHLNCDGSLHNVSRKMINSFKMVKDFEFDYLVRTNSSSYVDKQMLYSFLMDRPKEKFVGAVIGMHGNIQFASGALFMLSRDIFNEIIENENIINLQSYSDDVCLGEFFKIKNIPITNKDIDRFDVVTNVNSENIPNNYFHYRLKNDNRMDDVEYMKIIHEIKKLCKKN